MLSEFYSFLVVWYTGLPAIQNIEVRHFFKEQDVCEFISNGFNIYSNSSTNKPVLYGMKYSDSNEKGLDLEYIEQD